MKNRPFQNVSLLAFSPVSGYGGFNTSAHRIYALGELGFKVSVVDSLRGIPRNGPKYLMRRASNYLFRQGLPVPVYGGGEARKLLVEAANQAAFELLWLEKAIFIDAQTLRTLRGRHPDMRIVGFAPDDMNARHNQSRQFVESLQLYHHFFTTKSYNIAELRGLGCPDVRFVGNGYDERFFRPVSIRSSAIAELGGDVGFIGTFEMERGSMIRALAEAGFSVRVWGGDWHKLGRTPESLVLEHKPLYWDSFSRAVSSFRINLNFLRKKNRDLQTTRSVEIPACGGFMLAERTDEHLSLFEEGVEAEYFSSPEELVEKCRYYLANESKRRRIAQAGYERCVKSGYSNQRRLQAVFESVFGSC